MESFYYYFGQSDVVAIQEVPDATTAAAISMGIKVTGAVNINLNVPISPSEIDAASKSTIGYRAPGNRLREQSILHEELYIPLIRQGILVPIQSLRDPAFMPVWILLLF